MTARARRTPPRGLPGENGRPLSVLQIMTCRGWSSDAWAAMRLTLGLQAEGHRVMMLCRGVEGGREVAERIRAAGVEEIDFIEASGNFRPASYLRDIAKIRRIAREREVDAAHAHRGVEHWLAAAALSGRRGPALVRSRHILRPVSRHLLNRWLYASATDATVAVAEKIRKGYVEDGAFAGGSFFTVMGGADASAYDPEAAGSEFRDSRGIPRGAPLVGVAGSVMFWIKGQDVFLRAAARLIREKSLWAIVIGEGEDADPLRRMAAELGVEKRVAFTGFLPSLSDALAACDVLAFPSLRSEGTSRTLFDYLAAGRPVVASRVGCVDEIVRHEKEGLLVPPGDEEALSAAVERLISNPDLARSMGRSARARAEREFDQGVAARRMAEIYREVIRSKGRASASPEARFS